MKVTVIFDIGKTNKKCFVFDEKYRVVWKEYVRIDEIKDEDGYPCDDLNAIEKWIKKSLSRILNDKQFDVRAINFSTYGASFVHIDKKGKPVTPLYNYLKPYPPRILEKFYDKYGSQEKIAKETASPPLQMLNSGLQLFWLKHAHPKVYKKIAYSLHFPQYLSYLLTGKTVSEYTSIGCHTSLWNFKKKDYHDWVYTEKIDKKLPPIVKTTKTFRPKIAGQKITTGVGIHDSSSALIPYIQATKKPFLLISTGTWSIALNPFSREALTKKDLRNDCLNFMKIDGGIVKAARLFLGNEYKNNVEILQKYFDKDDNYHKKIKFNKKIFLRLKSKKQRIFTAQTPDIKSDLPSLSRFESFEEAYHQLMFELVEKQVIAAKRAIGTTKIDSIYVDGGFAANDIFIKLLALNFKKYKIRITQSPLGSALGAAIVVSGKTLKHNFLKKHYSMKKQHPPLITI